MKKKIFIILLVSVLLIPSTVFADTEYCEEEFTKADASIQKINEVYDDNIGFYNESLRYTLPTAGRVPMCQLFCRETITYKFYDTVYAMAGQSFKYDIFEDQSFLTSSFKGKKECFTWIDYEKWEEDYKTKNKAVVTAWDELKQWEAAVAISQNGQKVNDSMINTPQTNLDGYDACGCNYGMGYTKWIKGVEEWFTICDGHKPQSGNTCYHWLWNADNTKRYNSTTYVFGEVGTGRPVTNGKNVFDESYGDCECRPTPKSCGNCCGCSTGSQKQVDGQSQAWAIEQVKNSYNSALNKYKTALTERENWIIDLADCNMYTGANYAALKIKDEIGEISFDVKGRTDVRTKIIKQYPSVFPSCAGSSNSKFLSMDDREKYKITYGDDKKHDMEYGQTPVLDYEVTRLGGTETTYCNAGNNVVVDGGYTCGYSFKKANATRKLDYIECEGIYSSSKCKNVVKEVPVNNYAYFSTEVKMDLWQDETYEVFAYSGVAKTCDSGTSNNTTTIPLDPYSYPISLQTPSGSYDVTTQYACVGDMQIKRPEPYRANIEDSASYTCNVIVDNETTLMDCDDDCCLTDACDTAETCKKDKSGACITDGSNLELGFVFRAVNLENIFPSSRKRGKNWTTEFANKVVEFSKTKASTIWSSKPEYSYVLSATNRQNIRNYNRKMENQNGSFEGVTDKVTFISSGYLSNDLTCGVDGKEFVNCKSGFLAMNNALTGPEQFFTGGKVE